MVDGETVIQAQKVQEDTDEEWGRPEEIDSDTDSSEYTEEPVVKKLKVKERDPPLDNSIPKYTEELVSKRSKGKAREVPVDDDPLPDYEEPPAVSKKWKGKEKEVEVEDSILEEEPVSNRWKGKEREVPIVNSVPSIKIPVLNRYTVPINE